MEKINNLYHKFYVRNYGDLIGYKICKDTDEMVVYYDHEKKITENLKSKDKETEKQLLKEMEKQFVSVEENLDSIIYAKAFRDPASFALGAMCLGICSFMDNMPAGVISGSVVGSASLIINYYTLGRLANDIVLTRNFLDKENKINEIVMNDEKFYNGLTDETKQIIEDQDVLPLNINTIHDLPKKDRVKILGYVNVDRRGREIWYREDIEKRVRK